MTLLSVVIPHLNEPADLRRCLKALRDQDRLEGSMEIIVADNGSTVSPADICAAFPNVRLEIETTPGPGPARNRGVEIATAELIAFIDADCLADPGWAATMVAFMDRHPQMDFAGGDIRIMPGDENRLTAVEAYESIFSYLNRKYVEEHGFSATGNMIVRKSVFRSVGPFKGIDAMEDTEWGQRATRGGYRIGYVENAIVRTPACRSYGQLRERWARHVAHEYRDKAPGPRGAARWLARALALVLSPVAEIPRILASDRVAGPRERILAFGCLVRIRLYRSLQMVRLIFNDSAAATVQSWNRGRNEATKHPPSIPPLDEMADTTNN